MQDLCRWGLAGLDECFHNVIALSIGGQRSFEAKAPSKHSFELVAVTVPNTNWGWPGYAAASNQRLVSNIPSLEVTPNFPAWRETCSLAKQRRAKMNKTNKLGNKILHCPVCETTPQSATPWCNQLFPFSLSNKSINFWSSMIHTYCIFRKSLFACSHPIFQGFLISAHPFQASYLSHPRGQYPRKPKPCNKLWHTVMKPWKNGEAGVSKKPCYQIKTPETLNVTSGGIPSHFPSELLPTKEHRLRSPARRRKKSVNVRVSCISVKFFRLITAVFHSCFATRVQYDIWLIYLFLASRRNPEYRAAF